MQGNWVGLRKVVTQYTRINELETEKKRVITQSTAHVIEIVKR